MLQSAVYTGVLPQIKVSRLSVKVSDNITDLLYATASKLKVYVTRISPELPSKVKEKLFASKSFQDYLELGINPQHLSEKLIELIGEWQEENQQDNLDLIDSNSEVLSGYKTKQILTQSQHRLLILNSPSNISQDYPIAFCNYLKREIRQGIGEFVKEYYPSNSMVCPVKFYSNYLKQPINKLNIGYLQTVLNSTPTVIIHNSITGNEICFTLAFWGLNYAPHFQFSLPGWNWEGLSDALEAEGERTKKIQRELRKFIVLVNQILAGFMADWYYVNINPVYEPRLFQLESVFPQKWLTPFLEPLRDVYYKNQSEIYYQKGVKLTNISRYQEAIASFDRALEFQPSHPNAFNQRQVALDALSPEKMTEKPPQLPEKITITTDDFTGWRPALQEELNQLYFKELLDFVAKERQTGQVFPPENELFTAFSLTPLDHVKVVILGQDPYHDDGQAHGLSFSVKEGVKLPPSLRNIFQELQNDLGVTSNNSNLSSWARQGVLLLNTVLTVRAHTPNSHKDKGWERFTDTVIRTISNQRPHVVFVLWGRYAQKKIKLIDKSKHTIIQSAHPSPLSARHGFFDSKPFSQINAALCSAGDTEIDWSI